MSKEFKHVVLVCLGIVLIIPLTMLGGGGESYVIGIGVTALGLAVLLFFTGVFLLLPATSRNYGKAFLLTSGLLLLAGFTVCSTAAGL